MWDVTENEKFMHSFMLGSRVFLDEPTGNLDSAAGGDIIGTFEELWAKGHTLVLITHDPAIARRSRRVIHVQDGAVVEDAPAA